MLKLFAAAAIAALSAAQVTAHIHLCRRFGKGEERGSEPDAGILAEEFPGKI